MGTEYDIRVKVDPAQAQSGAKKVEKSINSIGTAADKVGTLIKRALAFTGVALGIRQLGQLADAYTNIQNRLKTVTTGTQQLSAVTSELFKISNQTRSQYEATAEVYARVALATKEMGIAQSQTLAFTKSLNQAVLLSGASAQEAQAGLIQLSQGLASGTLRGDELRSVLEQLPAVADVIAKGLSVTRGELRNMGAEGKITADIVIDAFAKAREELNEKFAKAVPTLGQAFTVLRNKVLQNLGAFDQNIGVTRTLASVILVAADNMGTLVRAASALAIVLSVQLAQKGIGAAITGIRTLTAVIASNPIGAIAVAATMAVAALIAFSDQIQIGSDGITTLRDYGVAAFQLLVEKIGPLVGWIRDQLTSAIILAQTYLASFGLTFEDLLNGAKTTVNTLIGLHVGLGKALQTIFTEIRALILRAMGSELGQSIINTFKSVLDFLIEGFIAFGQVVLRILKSVGLASVELGNAIGESIGIPDLTVPQEVLTFGGKVKEAFLEGFNRDFVGDVTSAITPAFQAIQERAQEVAQKRRDELQRKQQEQSQGIASLSSAGPNKASQTQGRQVDEIIDKLKKEGEALGLTNSETEIQQELLKISKKLNRELTESEAARITEQLKINEALKLQGELYQEIQSPVEEYMKTQQALNTLLSQGKITAEQYAAALQQTTLATSLQDLQIGLSPTSGYDQEMTDLATSLQERNELIRQAQEARLISEQEALNLSLEANRQYNQAILDMELSRYSEQLEYGTSIFSSLAQISEAFAGDQSGIYQAMFKASKAFAIADATVKIIQGIASAAATPWPANLGAMASVAAATAGLVAEIQSTNLPAYQSGGQFKVGGSGGADSQLVAFRATPNETVAVRTPGQQRQEESRPQAPEASPVNVLNVLDPSLLDNYMNTPAGERTVVNIIKRNKRQVSGLLGG